MSKDLKELILLLTGVVMIVFSSWLIKDDSSAHVINIIASLLLIESFSLALRKVNKKYIVVCCYVGIAIFLVNILLDLIGLARWW